MWSRAVGVFYLAFSAWVFLIPGVRCVSVLADPAIQSGGIPRMAWSLHKTLSPRYETWARLWVEKGVGTQVSVHDVAGTEWPLFGSCFYLWATEALQEAHKAAGRDEPLRYARGAVEAATRLVIDPRSAEWVKEHWGESYLTKENVFYRMLVMSAIISHHRLTGSAEHLEMLRQQVEGMVKELDASPAGLLDDYPRQCYPTDVLAVLYAIKRADPILGTDHTEFLNRALRGFTGPQVKDLGLPPYSADADTGRPHDRSRGCGNSYLTMHAPYLWPDQAGQWYEAYDKNFWQRDWLAMGFREFPNDEKMESYFDVDSGPVIRGIGFAASAFGLAGARVNGRFDHAHPLTAMMIVTSLPFPDGTLWIPRFLSSTVDAPYLGESAILYSLTRTPAVKAEAVVPSQGGLCGYVWLVLGIYFGVGGLIFRRGWRLVRYGQWRKVQVRA